MFSVIIICSSAMVLMVSLHYGTVLYFVACMAICKGLLGCTHPPHSTWVGRDLGRKLVNFLPQSHQALKDFFCCVDFVMASGKLKCSADCTYVLSWPISVHKDLANILKENQLYKGLFMIKKNPNNRDTSASRRRYALA